MFVHKCIICNRRLEKNHKCSSRAIALAEKRLENFEKSLSHEERSFDDRLRDGFSLIGESYVNR